MRRVLWLVATVTLLALLPARMYAQEAEEGKTVASKITAVTVYADRASVARSATVDFGPGVEKLAFRKLPAWLDAGSVRVSVTPPDACELVDVEVRRDYLAKPDDAELQKAQAAVQDMQDQIAALDDEKTVLDAQSRQLDAIRTFSLEKMPRDTAIREIKVEEYNALVKFMGTSLTDIAKAKRALEVKKRDLQPQLEARRKKYEELRRRAQLEQNTVLVTARRGAANRGTLTLSYLLPGATWEPTHEVRAGGTLDKVMLGSFAVVSQTTGEDWDGIALTLSTQRPTRTMRIPELEKLVAGARTTTGDVSFGVASRNFADQFDLWNTTYNPVAFQAEIAANRKAQERRQASNIDRFQRVQEQRGTTAHFAATGTQTIRTDGRTVRVPIGSAQLDAEARIVAVPEMSLNAVRTAEMTNTGKQPLLPGSVLLFVEGAFLGTTDVDFVASGESFPMYVGVADQVKLSRTLDRKRSTLTWWTGKRKRMQVSFVVTTENLSDKPVTLQLADRIPVSETDEIRVIGVKIQPDAKADAKGILKWDVALAAKETKEFRIDYTLEYPAELPQVETSLRERDAARAVRGAAPQEAPAPEGLFEQIKKLEKAF